MLDIQRYKDYERFRLISDEGLSEAEANAVLNAEKRPFKPAFPKTSAVMMDQHAAKGPQTSLAERIASFHRARQQQS
jgi:hypothetical protein